jgi:hypothetical protein
MASGSWGGVGRIGNRPSHLDPWSKSILGWVTPARVMNSSIARNIGAVEAGGEISQFLPNLSEGGTGEYFLLENRQQYGFDVALPGSGLLLWHIDEKISTNNCEWYPGCTACTSHYKVALVQADGLYQMEKKLNRGDSGDPFPGSTDNRAISPWSLLPASLYGDASAGFGFSSISDSGMVMSADFTLYDLIKPVTFITSSPTATSASRSGRFTFSANESAVFDCKLDDLSFFPCSSPFTFSDLADGSHTFTVRATDTAGNVEAAPPTYTWTIDTVALLCNVSIFDSCYQNIADAYAAIPLGGSGIILLQQGDYPETLDFNRSVVVKLVGGFDSGFVTRSGTSVIAGRVTDSAGTLVIDRVGLRYDAP